ncbi:hypothetical protein HHX47_DHR5000731 [Lentinula edodes]|nr:hypothetical protein HHX47_DHR5000731 [Lentinula edodes]
MNEIFTMKGIPVVPSLGKPRAHLISQWLNMGPNSITNEFYKIWQAFIPFPYQQAFQRGAYFAVEVVPNALAVISLNTLYFYDANDAVGGCSHTEPNDPGNLQFTWLEDQLKSYREREMQFFLIEAKDIEVTNDIHHGLKHDNLCDSLLDDFAQLPKSGRTDLDDYAVINVSPPVVPNPYLPTFRVFTYNITDVKDALADSSPIRQMNSLDSSRSEPLHRRKHRDNSSQCKEGLYRSSWKCQLQFEPPISINADAPSRTSRLWTPLGYAQYFIPDLKDNDKSHPPRFELEYTTLPASVLLPEEGQNLTEFRYPIPLRNLPNSLREGKMKKKYFPYEMKDLTIGSWLDLARRLGDVKEKKLRGKFRQYMYLGGT